jgi:hypothetical protein
MRCLVGAARAGGLLDDKSIAARRLIAVKWKLWTRNDIIGKGFDEFASKDAALERARETTRQLHVKVL